MKIYTHKETCRRMFKSSLVAPNWKQLKCPSTGEWLNKIRFILIIEYYSVVKEIKLFIMLERV